MSSTLLCYAQYIKISENNIFTVSQFSIMIVLSNTGNDAKHWENVYTMLLFEFEFELKSSQAMLRMITAEKRCYFKLPPFSKKAYDKNL